MENHKLWKIKISRLQKKLASNSKPSRRLFYVIYLVIYLKLTNLQKHSIHIYIKIAIQIG